MAKTNFIKRTLCTLALSAVLLASISVSASAKTDTKRLAGSGRIQTAIEVSKSGWTQSDYVILATGWNYPDSLSAAPLAKKYNAPILLTEVGTMSDELRGEITRLKAKHVFILGGTGAVSQNVEDQLKGMGMETERLAGDDRFETSVKIAEKVGNNGEIVIAFSHDYSDALSVSSIAAAKNMPVILVYNTVLHDPIKNYLKTANIKKTYVIGDKDVISDDVVSQFPGTVRITGSDKYERNLQIINTFANDIDFSNVCVARGDDFADSLSGSALAAIKGSPIVLVNKNDMSKVEQLLSKKNVSKLTVFGGTGAVSDNIVNEVSNSIPSNNSSGNTDSGNTTQTDEDFKVVDII